MHKGKWEIYEDKQGEWRWRHTASNGNIVGAASEGYKNKEACIKNAEHYGYNDKFNNAGTWEMYQDKKEEWRWRHTAANGEIIGSSTQGYQHKQDCIDNAKINGYVA